MLSAVAVVALLTPFVEASLRAEVGTLRLQAKVSGSAEASSGTVQGTLRPAEGNPLDSLDVDLPLEGHSDLAVPAGSKWRLEITDDRWWGPRKSIVAEAAVQVIQVPVFRAGSLEGRLRLPKGTGPPERLRIRFQPAPSEALRIGVQSGECLVDGVDFQCKTPAAVLDLRLRMKGFASAYRWGVSVLSIKPSDLGTLRLLPGASVIGWVEPPEDPAFRYSAAKISLLPIAAMPPQNAAGSARRGIKQRRAAPNERGFFEIAGVPPGSYELTLDHPGFATTRRVPVQVLEGAETELRELVLEKPATLTITVRQPHDPFGKPWHIALYPVRRPEKRVELEPDPENGLVEIKALEPGPYYLNITDSRGSLWWTTEEEVLPGGGAIEVEISIHRLEGTLLNGSDPLQANLWFGGQRAAPSIRVQSNEEGKFYVFLPEPYGPYSSKETWDVEIKSGSLHVWIDDVEVPETLPGEPWPRTTLRIPETRLEGTVETRQGLPVPRAIVRAQSADGRSLQARPSSEGRFEFLGLAPELWTLEADGSLDGRERLTSKPVTATVEEKITAEPVKLVLESRASLSGQVIAPDGAGVPGAMVVASSSESSGRVFDLFSRTLTDVDGIFSFSLALEVGDPVTLTVFPPGFALTQVEAAVPRIEAPILIPVATAAGTLVVTYEGGEAYAALQKRRRTWLIRPAGPVGTPDSVEEWARIQGHRHGLETEILTVPGLAPGFYAVCFGSYPTVLNQGNCASGEVSPFGELQLKLSLDSPDALTGEQSSSQ